MDLSYFNFPGLSWPVVADLLWSVLCGGLVGVERSARGRQAGVRTYAIVSLAAACLMSAITQETSAMSIGDPASRVIQGLLTGLGFLGAGVIMQHGFNIKGLTTAASIWLTSGIGIMCGMRQWGLAVFVTCMALAILAGLKLIEARIARDHYSHLTIKLNARSMMDIAQVRLVLASEGMRALEVAFKRDFDKRMEYNIVAVFDKLDCPARLTARLSAMGEDIDAFEISSSPE